MRPTISIITVSYNAADTIRNTLESVRSQVGAYFEHIVVDGGSTDGTMRVVQECAHDCLFALSEPDNGIYDAMNKGIARSSGDYIIFLNADDYFACDDALTRASSKIAETGADCLFADTQFVDAQGATGRQRLYSAERFAPWWLRVGAQPPHPSMFMRRELLRQLGGFDTSYRIAGDFDLIARAVLKHGASFATLPLVITHFRPGGVSTAGLKSKLTLNREIAHSLRRLGQPLAGGAVWLRMPLKLLQFHRPFGLRRKADG